MLNYHRMRCWGFEADIVIHGDGVGSAHAHANAKAAPRHPSISSTWRSTAQGMPMPVSAASRRAADERLAHRASGALGPDVTGAAEERDDEIMQDFRDLIKGL
jgi:hypothetical protein